VAAEAPDVLAVAKDPGSTGIDVATQVAGAGGKLAAAGLGAKAGAVAGAFGGPLAPITVPVGALLGGAAGYVGADKLIEGGRSAVGVDTRDPAQRIAAPQPSTNPSLRIRPEDTAAGPPTTAMQPTAAAPTASPVGGVTRVGNSYTGGPNISGDITINGRAPGGGAISAQNMAAADALAGRETLRGMAGGAPAPSGIPSMPVPGNSSNSWEARNNLRNLGVSASSITNRPGWSGGGRGYMPPDVQAYLGAQQADTAMRGGMDAGTIARTGAQASMFGAKTAADASRENSNNSLRGTMYTADATLGAKRMEMERSLRQQQLVGEVFRRNNGDPVATSKALAGFGLTEPAGTFQSMAAADQSRGATAAKGAQARLEGLAVRPDDKGGSVVDPGRLARVNSMVTKMAPNFTQMDEEGQAKVLSQVEAGVNLLEGMNDRRNTGFLQAVGWDGKSPTLDNLPDMKGGKLRTVGLKEGISQFGGVSTNDYVVEVGGNKLYLPRPSVNKGELELLKARGVDISGIEAK
jgi:hypothetical protein